MTYIVWYSSMENDIHLFNSKLKLAWLLPIKSAEGTDTHDTLIIDSNLTGCNSNQTGCMVQKQWNEKNNNNNNNDNNNNNNNNDNNNNNNNSNNNNNNNF